MCEERTKTRCVHCELMQWADHTNCRCCGNILPEPVVNVVERVVEGVIIRRDVHCLENLQTASNLISATAMRLRESHSSPEVPLELDSLPAVEPFPTLDEMERAMIIAAYRKSNRKPVEAARLLGIGKTTFYRKLREMRQIAA
jgi:transcriptional regulator of acetoin/glycerol metabolism